MPGRHLAGAIWMLACFGLAGQETTEVWQSLSQPAPDAEKSGTVRDLTLSRDRIRITLTEGRIQLVRPAAGVVYGAAFEGRGRVQVSPPNDTEKRQLRSLTGKEALDMEFSEAVFVFADGTAEELGGKVQWGAASGAQTGRLFLNRHQAREDVGEELLPRLFKSVLSGDRRRTALFAADLKTNEKGWIAVRHDALDLEEVSVGRWTNWGQVTEFDSWLSFPAGDRAAAEAHREPLAKEDFRIRGYRIDAAVTRGAELRASAQVTIEKLVAGERVLLFELDSNLRVESVKDGQGRALAFFQPRDPKDRPQAYGDYVAVVLPEPTAAGAGLTLEFRYAGKRVIRKEGSGNFFCQSYGWYPARPNHFAARADFEMTFKNPKGLVLVATGNKVSETTDGDTVISVWKSDLPLAVAGFAFGQYKVHSEKAGEVAIEVYANREGDDMLQSLERSAEDDLPQLGATGAGRMPIGRLTPAAMARTVGIEIGNTIKLFERYFGPYPYKRLAVTNIPYTYGQGWPMLIYLSAFSFLDSTQRQALGMRKHTEITDFFRAHEASHQWWGHRVGWKSYHDQWLSEGFAQFSGNLYVLFRQNEKEFVSRLRQDKQELLARDQRSRVYESLGPVWMGHRLASSESPDGYHTVVYNKGGLILNMLRSLLFDPKAQPPDARFITLMRDFCQTFHNRPASTEDFQAVVEKHMFPMMDLDGNGRLDWFFRQYVYGTGIPEYQLRYKVDGEGNKWKVQGVLARKGVPAEWKDLVRLYVHVSGRPVPAGWIRSAGPETPVNFELPMKPEKLSLNLNEDTLAKIE